MPMLSSALSSVPSRSRRSMSVTNTSNTSHRRRPQLVSRCIAITMIVILAVSFSSCSKGVTAATVIAPAPKVRTNVNYSNTASKKKSKSSKKSPSKKDKKGYYSGSEYYNSKSASKKKSKSSKKTTSLPTRRPTSDPPSSSPTVLPITNKYRWASSGGGWRSMVGVMGFANVFAQAGLITQDSSAFSSVSTVSGSSWFSTQFFYSPQFFKNVTTSTPEDLASFVLQWMTSYEAIFLGVNITHNPACDMAFQNLTIDIPDLTKLKLECTAFAALEEGGQWAPFVHHMLRAASSGYGDPGFEDRIVDVLNRVDAMNETNLYIQTSLAPNSRTRSIPNNAGNYLGPDDQSNDDVDIYSAPIAVQYSVTQTRTMYYSTDLDDGGTMLDYPIFLDEAVSPHLNFPEEYKEFGLYPVLLNKTVFDPDIENLKPTQSTLTKPFGGQNPSVTQIASASSASNALYSPLIPSLFSQGFSKLRDAVNEADKKLVFDKVVDQLYEAKIYDGQSVCTQWPEVCGKTDGQFLDGYYTDQCSLALNIGQYQSQNSDNIFTNGLTHQGEEEPLKVILTDINQFSDDDQALLPYFNSPINEGIAPGEYMWPADLFLPLMSPQVFALNMDSASLAGITKPIPGSNITVARILTTTVDNPWFHVKAGQRVDLLILRTNSNIPTAGILGKEAIQAFKGPLAEMAQGIAASAELLNVIQEFRNVPITALPTGASGDGRGDGRGGGSVVVRVPN